jgi:hypothetical protein
MIEHDLYFGSDKLGGCFVSHELGIRSAIAKDAHHKTMKHLTGGILGTRWKIFVNSNA